jgi:hypothetical protein
MWLLLAVLVVLTAVTALQGTRHALLPLRNTTALWISVASAVIAVLLLRSGMGTGGNWVAEQAKLGTIANTFYPPRREAMMEGGAVLGGVIGALWWGASSWVLLMQGMRYHFANRGLFDFEVSAVVGALSGAVDGAVVGLFGGWLWEQWHRRRRQAARVPR